VRSTDEQRWFWAEATKFAIEAGKGLMLINGGGAISILTFLGNNKQMQSPPSVWAIVFFAVGALLATSLFGSSYATQLYYGNAAGGKPSVWERRWHIASYAFALGSALAFVAGMILAAVGLGSVALSSPPGR
jgi:hypothetical protein